MEDRIPIFDEIPFEDRELAIYKRILDEKMQVQKSLRTRGHYIPVIYLAAKGNVHESNMKPPGNL